MAVWLLSDDYAEDLAAGVAKAADTVGLAPIVMSAHGSMDVLEENIYTLGRIGVRGLIVAAGSVPKPHRQRLTTALDEFVAAAAGVCTVGFELPGFSSVTADEAGGALSLVDLLVRANYQSIAVLAGPTGDDVAATRTSALVGALKAHAITPAPLVVVDANTRDAGWAATRAVLNDAPPPQALVAVTEPLALGALDALQDARLSVPEDVALAHMGAGAGSRHRRTLTHAPHPVLHMGQAACELALLPTLVPAPPRRLVYPVGAVLGRSTGLPQASV